MNKLRELSEQLEIINLTKESIAVIKLASNQAIIPIAESFTENFNLLKSYYSKFSHLTLDEIKQAIAGILSRYKISELSNNSLKKEAQLKTLFFNSLRIIPVVGFIVNFLITLNNLKNSIYHFYQMQSDALKLNLNPIKTLIPNELRKEARVNKDNIDNLNILLDLTTNSKLFYDEAISLVFNSMDFVKDVIFLFVELSTLGLTIFADIGFSVLFALLEYVVEGYVLDDFDPIITLLTELIISNKREYNEVGIDELNRYFGIST